MSARSLNWLKFGGLVALAFALGLLFAGLLDLPNRGAAQAQGQQASAIAPVPTPTIPAARPLQELSEAFAAVAEHVKPSVVYIRSQRTEHPSQQRIPPGMERFFSAFAEVPEDGPVQEEFARLGSEAGMEVVGPPLAQSDPAPSVRG